MQTIRFKKDVIIMLKSFNEKLRKIKQEVEKIADDFAYDLAHQAEQDLQNVHKQIIDNFYAEHTPNSYNRRKGLYDSLIPQEVYSLQSSKNYVAEIVVGSFNMDDHYRGEATPDYIFDLMWNQGVRGLPQKGTEKLSKNYVWLNRYYDYGDNPRPWENPYWSGHEAPYHNLFVTTITLGKYTTKTPGVPHDVMTDFVNHWDKAGGKEACKRISKDIKNRYKNRKL